MKALAAVLAMLSFAAPAATDVYDFRLKVLVPRIYDNAQSLGRREWQTQVICGEMHVSYGEYGGAPVIAFSNCVNRTHKIDGRNVTYRCGQGYDEVVRRWVVMGDNRKGVFKDGSCFFFADFEPSYNVGDDEPDNSLLLYFSGSGTLGKVAAGRAPCESAAWKVGRWRGYCVGTMGCGCRAYGHVSPTRALGFRGAECDAVTDVAAIPRGQWYATYRRSY